MEYVYGALLLHKLGQPINEEYLKKVIHATGKEVDESKIKVLVASLKDIDIEKELASATLAVSAAPGQAAKEEVKAEDKKEEKKEAAAEGLSALFG